MNTKGVLDVTEQTPDFCMARLDFSTRLPSVAEFDDALSRVHEAGKAFGAEEGKKLTAELRTLGPMEMRRRLKELRREASSFRREQVDNKKHEARLRGLLSAHDDLSSLIEGGMTLERAHSSALHRLRQSIHEGAFFINRNRDELDSTKVREYNDLFASAHAFVIQHNWAEAFRNATEYDGITKFRLPFETCVFEFKVSGRAVILLAAEADGLVYVQLAAETNENWFSFERAVPFDEDLEGKYRDGTFNPISSLIVFLRPQIKAVAVALDAEVAEIEIARAPHKLNRAREKAGRPPISDYHVVSLASRQRAKPLANPQQTGERRRLHFRRGHWRHFETFKTWVRWTLVGDPDLGFVDKEYRL
jgi:hypothetical protein